MNIGCHLMRSAKAFSERTAIVDQEVRLTYRELNSRVNRFAAGLRSLGLEKGDRVAQLSGNSFQIVEAVYACYKIGLVTVPLNARAGIPEIIQMVSHADTKALILGEEHIGPIEDNRSAMKGVDHFIAVGGAPSSMVAYTRLLDFDEAEPDVEVEAQDLAEVKYTSGTSGVLKAAMLSHGNLLSKARKHLLVPGIDIDRSTIMCHVAPVTHASGGWILPVISRGGCNVLLREFDEKTFLETIQKEKVTHFFAVPTMLNFLMSRPDIRSYDLSSIRSIVYGASPMPPERIRQALETFGPVLIQGYGQTETSSGFIFLTKEDHVLDGDADKLRRLASAGLPCFDTDVKVVNNQGREVKPGEVGEIIQRSDGNMVGYWKDPELTAKQIRDGWIYTKDMATVDEHGYIYIVDRKEDMIISGGFNIYPSEVESALYEHPAVFEAAVIGVPDDKWGESVKAFVVLREGTHATQEDLIDHCKARLSSYKKPKSVEFVDKLPKNHYGKTVRRMLKEKYWAGQVRMVH